MLKVDSWEWPGLYPEGTGGLGSEQQGTNAGEPVPLDPRDTLLLVEFLIPCPLSPENPLSTELTTETILSLEYGRL